MRNTWLAVLGVVIAALIVAGCGSSKTASKAAGTASPAAPHSPVRSATMRASPAASAFAASTLKTAKVKGVTVLTDAKGFTVYSFAPDTATTSKCIGSCATFWPPVKAPAAAGTGVTGSIGMITRSDGTKQATYHGRPLYTYAGDHAPGEAAGNGLNVNGGLWRAVEVSGG